MEYYCVMVMTGQEEEFKKEVGERMQALGEEVSLWFFMRRMRTRAGKVYDEPLFRGYVFLGVRELTREIITEVRASVGCIHFLNSNRDIRPLMNRDRDYVQQFISFGEVQGFSRATFNENSRIVVVDGPLKGFAGKIIRVNRRNQRATVRLDMFNSSITFDLMYDLIKEES